MDWRYNWKLCSIYMEWRHVAGEDWQQREREGSRGENCQSSTRLWHSRDLITMQGIQSTQVVHKQNVVVVLFTMTRVGLTSGLSGVSVWKEISVIQL